MIDLINIPEKKIQLPEEPYIFPVFGRGMAVLWLRENLEMLADVPTLITNVRRVVAEHSPDGFEIGYAGSGPADLALNIMAALFPVKDTDQAVKCFAGQVSRQAWDLHQPFKFKFLCGADRNHGAILWESIEEWLKEFPDNPTYIQVLSHETMDAWLKGEWLGNDGDEIDG